MRTFTTDVVIIGAGPVGIFQAFELGLQGLKAILIDSLPEIGGQCTELYPDKPIFDIPALPNATAKQTIDNLWQQAEAFDPMYILGERVDGINKHTDTFFSITTSKQTLVYAKAVIIAGGNGAFSPVKLKIANIEQFENKQLFYRINNLSQFKDKNVVVLGGGDAALDWALTLQETAESVLLIHRSHNFRAAQSSVDKMMALCEQLKMQFFCGQVSGFQQKGDRLSSISVSSNDGVTRKVELEALVVLFGMSPKLGPISQWDLAMHNHQIQVDTQSFQSSVSGIYAVGDINYYPGKRKLILSGFHEAALASFAIAESLSENKRIPTLYTTTSALVHKRMGVDVSLASLME
jgi:thioredoxin reductase (NADPH)